MVLKPTGADQQSTTFVFAMTRWLGSKHFDVDVLVDETAKQGTISVLQYREQY